ncbi:SsrA-binding protein SmpB [Deltaproteobacteria bacterium TL4]
MNKTLVTNRKAHFNYEIIQTYEAGIALRGTEVKSLRSGHANIAESHCRISSNLEIYLVNAHINQYDFGNRNNHDPLRERQLLLHKAEIRRLYGQSREKGLTLVPLKLYLKKGRVKIEIALVKGKKIHDKRESLKLKASERDMARDIKHSISN